jgi:hypothetical protein
MSQITNILIMAEELSAMVATAHDNLCKQDIGQVLLSQSLNGISISMANVIAQADAAVIIEAKGGVDL